MRLYFHKASSASLRVLLFVRYAADDRLTLVEVDGAPPGADSAFLLPEGDPEALRLGTRDYNAFNPEGRIPVLLLAPGRQLTQSGAILLFLMSTSPVGSPMRALTPADPWQHAVARQLADIIACDIHPLQNKPVTQRHTGSRPVRARQGHATGGGRQQQRRARLTGMSCPAPA